MWGTTENPNSLAAIQKEWEEWAVETIITTWNRNEETMAYKTIPSGYCVEAQLNRVVWKKQQQQCNSLKKPKAHNMVQQLFLWAS